MLLRLQTQAPCMSRAGKGGERRESVPWRAPGCPGLGLNRWARYSLSWEDSTPSLVARHTQNTDDQRHEKDTVMTRMGCTFVYCIILLFVFLKTELFELAENVAYLVPCAIQVQYVQ